MKRAHSPDCDDCEDSVLHIRFWKPRIGEITCAHGRGPLRRFEGTGKNRRRLSPCGRRRRAVLIRSRKAASQVEIVWRVLVIYFDSRRRLLLRSNFPGISASRPRRLARPRTSPFHGGNAGSNPAGDANVSKYLSPSYLSPTLAT